jgi:hypothetical protein
MAKVVSKGAERAARFRESMAAQGYVQVAMWVPAAAVADMNRAAQLMRENPKLTVGRLTDTTTGRLRGLK